QKPQQEKCLLLTVSLLRATIDQMRRFLVTGCAGFIGSHLTDALLERGDAVVGLDAFTDYYDRALKEENLAAAREHPEFELVEADLTTHPLEELLSEVEAV